MLFPPREQAPSCYGGASRRRSVPKPSLLRTLGKGERDQKKAKGGRSRPTLFPPRTVAPSCYREGGSRRSSVVERTLGKGEVARSIRADGTAPKGIRISPLPFCPHIEGMKTRIYIDRRVIAENQRTGKRKPPIVLRTYKGTRRAFGVEIRGPCRLVYFPDKPLSCGARLWLETEEEMEVIF